MAPHPAPCAGPGRDDVIAAGGDEVGAPGAPVPAAEEEIDGGVGG
jgi:hypothetical protein